MEFNDFYSFFDIQGICSNVKQNSRKSIGWRDLKWIRVEKNRPFIMQYKHTLSEDFEFYDIDWSARNKGRPAKLVLNPLKNDRPKIKYLKWKNLQELLEFVPPVHHQFYNNLPHEDPPKEKKKGKKKQRKEDDADDLDDEGGKFLLLSDEAEDD